MSISLLLFRNTVDLPSMHKRGRSVSPCSSDDGAVALAPLLDLPDGYDSDGGRELPVDVAARAFVDEHGSAKPSVAVIWAVLKELARPVERKLKYSYEAAKTIFKFRGLRLYESRATFAERATRCEQGKANAKTSVRVLRDGLLWPTYVPLSQIYSAKTECKSKASLAATRVAQGAKLSAARKSAGSTGDIETLRVSALEALLDDDAVIARHLGNRFAHRYARRFASRPLRISFSIHTACTTLQCVRCLSGQRS